MDKGAERAAAGKAWQEPHAWGWGQIILGTETSPFSPLLRNIASDRQLLPVLVVQRAPTPPPPGAPKEFLGPWYGLFREPLRVRLLCRGSVP